MFLEESEAGIEGKHVGIVQPLGSSDVLDGWALLDGSSIPTNAWFKDEPNDGDTTMPPTETDRQNCARLTVLGLRDGECDSQMNGYFCEQIP